MAVTTFGFQIGSSLATQYLTDSKYIRAGYTVVQTKADLDTLPVDTGSGGVTIKGSLAYVANDSTTSNNGTYRYNGSEWVKENDVGTTVPSGAVFTDTTYSLSGAASGNTWVTTLTPSSGTATTSIVPAMGGASSAAAGAAGLVPKPAAGNQNKFLHGDGTWTSNIEPTGEIITSNNIVLNANNKAIIQSPIPKYLWHDLFAFCRVATPTYYTSTDNETWTGATLVKDLFAQKENQSKAVLTSTITGARWQWQSSNFSYSNGAWLVIGFAWSSSPPTYTITFESSADGTTWTQRHQSSGNTVSAPRWFYLNGGYSNHTYLRLTITKPVDNTSAVNLSAIKLLSYRWGDQGQGSELEFPYNWDANANILPISNNAKNLGSSSLKWANVYATTFNGALSGNATTATNLAGTTSPHYVYAGPASGDTAGAPAFRALVASDIPSLTKSKISDFPTEVSSFTNDAGYLTSFTETDPTVPAWAKASTKPSYSLSEITGASDVQAIEVLSGTSGLLKKTAANTWELDTNTYVTSSGVTSITLKAGAGITLDTDNTAITSTGTRTISISGVDTTSGSTSQVLSKKGTWVDLPTASSLGLSSAMIFKGSLGTGGTITSLPAAASGNTGYTYKVITAGTYQSIAAKVGDVLVSNGSSWTLIPSGDEPSGTVTSIGAGVGLTVNGNGANPITASGTIDLIAATSSALGGIQIGYQETANNYAVKLDNKQAYVTVPYAATFKDWTV